jgi:hypothetical protein
VAGDNSSDWNRLAVNQKDEVNNSRLTVLHRTFASDFSHEIAMEDSLYEIDESSNGRISYDKHKTVILGENAKRFYNL